MMLNQKADIYRVVPDTSVVGRRKSAIWRKGVPCHLEPVSTADLTVPYALESTHCVFLPTWLLGVRREDEIHLGGDTSPDGTRRAFRFIVVGVRRFPTFGLRHAEAFCKERL